MFAVSFEGASENMSLCRLNRVFYPVTTLGYGERLGVWVQGCTRHCDGCMSPEMQQTDSPLIEMENVIRRLPKDINPDGLTISGGEPFDQPLAVKELMTWFLSCYGDDVLIYSGYLIEELKSRHDKDIDWILSHIAAIVDGPYDKMQNDGIGMRGSANQRLHVFRHHDRYAGFEHRERIMQCVQENDRLFLIGVLPKKGG